MDAQACEELEWRIMGKDPVFIIFQGDVVVNISDTVPKFHIRNILGKMRMVVLNRNNVAPKVQIENILQ